VRPALGTATEADVLKALEARRKRICELIDGVLVEKPMGCRESLLAQYLAFALIAFVRPRKLGLVMGADAIVRLFPGRLRVPDLAFFSWDRLPDRRVPDQPILPQAPDLAIEVLSISNTLQEMLLKRQDYFAAAVGLVWEIDPRARTVHIYSSPETPDAVLSEADVLEGSPILPGFELPLQEFFAGLDERG
jgi:Uma2 family endonuclease